MENPKKIWDELEEIFEKMNIRRRQITGGDIEDDLVLRGKSLVYLMDEAYDLMDDSLERIHARIMDGVYDLGLGAKENLDEVADDIKGLREHMKKRRIQVEDENDKFKESDLLEEIQKKFSEIKKKLKD